MSIALLSVLVMNKRIYNGKPRFPPLLFASAALLLPFLSQPADFQTPLFQSNVNSPIPECAPTKI